MRANTPGIRLLITIAAAFIVIAGLRYAAGFLLPIVLAFFLAVLNLPFMRWFHEKGFPHLLAVIVTMLVNLALILGVVGLTVNILINFLPKSRIYVDGMQVTIEAAVDDVFQKTPVLNKTGQLQEGKETFYEMVRRQANHFSYELPTVNHVLDTITSLTGTSFFVFVAMIFFLSEARLAPTKLAMIREAKGPDLSILARASLDIQRYLAIKTVVSLATGLLAWLLTWAFGLDFPLLWGITAFALNYIPAIGSIIAAIPPCFLALSQLGLLETILIASGYLSINMALGNVIEPLLMGRRFGISTAVVVLCVLFWGWIWGVVGMFLAVPLTMMLKVMLDHSEEFRWIGVAIGNVPQEEEMEDEFAHRDPFNDGEISGPSSREPSS